MATVISSGLATLHELDTVYGIEDLWFLLEVLQVDRHNEAIINKVE
nr:transcription elongation factor GreA [Klebsiella pneumoniae]